MKLIKPYFEILEQEDGLEGVYKNIELVGRTCYHSQDKITADSAKEFVDRMIKSGHGAMLEFGTVYLKDYYDVANRGAWLKSLGEKYSNNKYSVVVKDNMSDMRGIYITTNMRVLVENGWMDDLKYLCEHPTKYHERRVCVRFICDRGVSHEFVRHRVMSFAQESTRFCNYSKDKFGNELVFIEPSWKPTSIYINNVFTDTLKSCEASYLALIRNGWKPQQARQVLPNALKTELVMTGFVSDWKHFFDLRCDAHAHPDAQYLANGLKKEFFKRWYIND